VTALLPTPPAPPSSSAPPARLRAVAEVGARLLGVVVAALVLAALVLPWRPPTLCFLRSVTGLPCPFCGGTTAFVRLGEGRPLAALAASPLAALGAPVFVAWPVLRGRVAAWTARVGRGPALAVLLGVLGLSWAWQLVRLG
jgi:hypothetical protein